MRPGDSILINASEAELLKSDRFQTIASPELTSKIELTPNSKPGYYRLALPKIGRSVVDALAVFAERDVSGSEAIAAEHLAAAIEQRLSGR
jgi:hypothetical protein